MIKRLYYYTCPIKALYMIKEFGVEFECKYYPEDIGDDQFYDFQHQSLYDIEKIGDLFDTDFGHVDKIYVKQESEEIFEPINGDIGIDIKDFHIHLYGDRWHYYIAGIPRMALGNIEIVLRNGKHFFAPEVENDNN